MVLILSVQNDLSTNHVIAWLDYMNIPWLRINGIDDIAFKSLEYKDNQIIRFEILINECILDLTKVTAYWYRRGWLNNYHQNIHENISDDEAIHVNIQKYLRSEIENVFHFAYHYLYRSKISINSFLTAVNDKSYYQFIASEVGLNVPDTLVCTEKKKLSDFVHTKPLQNAVTKSINELFSFEANRKDYFTTTYIIEDKDVLNGAQQFFPTLFQKYIDKFLELRIFYLKGKIYPMAIFSQQNEKTKIDFRKYDNDLPNRNVPFKLPPEIERKITFFMKRIDLNCGSIDMILTPENKFVFLEVNPVGQFGMVSNPCNYYLEKEIAKELSHAKQ